MARTHRRINVAAQVAASYFREADAWRTKGSPLNEQRALDAANAMLEREGIKSREEAELRASESVPFTVEEEAARDAEEAAIAAAAPENALRAIRQKRNALLHACDWTQLPDAPASSLGVKADGITPATVADWAAYRQALRDYPGTVVDPLNPPPWPKASSSHAERAI